jgi:hypothetical protein
MHTNLLLLQITMHNISVTQQQQQQQCRRLVAGYPSAALP